MTISRELQSDVSSASLIEISSPYFSVWNLVCYNRIIHVILTSTELILPIHSLY
jgi:hypothetical protein